MRAELERRLAGICEEIRRYPTPIARCDEQLTALLDERTRLMARLEEPACDPANVWADDGGPSQ